MKMNSGVATESAVEMIPTCLRYVQLGLRLVPGVGQADLTETFNPILHVLLTLLFVLLLLRAYGNM